MSFLSGLASGMANSSSTLPGTVSPDNPQGGILGSLGQDFKGWLNNTPTSVMPSAPAMGTPGPSTAAPASEAQPTPSSVVSPLGNPIAPVDNNQQDPLEKQFPLATKVANALGTIESSNNYNALGPQVHGQQAIGRYQVMPENVGTWSAQAGQPATVQQFQSNHELQDRVAIYHINTLLNEGYSPQDVASMWLSGKALHGNNAKDLATGISVPTYVQKFNNVFNSQNSMGNIA
jgi:hypothetical protein